ncbi:MAG: hypothetical protein ABSF63_12050 [Candidatus Bathyarchaeia archaeon]
MGLIVEWKRRWWQVGQKTDWTPYLAHVKHIGVPHSEQYTCAITWGWKQQKLLLGAWSGGITTELPHIKQ